MAQNVCDLGRWACGGSQGCSPPPLLYMFEIFHNKKLKIKMQTWSLSSAQSPVGKQTGNEAQAEQCDKCQDGAGGPRGGTLTSDLGNQGGLPRGRDSRGLKVVEGVVT